MQCERKAAREKRAHVNPWLSGDTSGPHRGRCYPPPPDPLPQMAVSDRVRAARGSGVAPADPNSRSSSRCHRPDAPGWVGGQGRFLFCLLTPRRLQDAQPGVQFAKSPNLAREPVLGASTRRRRKAGRGKGPPRPRGRTGGRTTQPPPRREGARGSGGCCPAVP